MTFVGQLIKELNENKGNLNILSYILAIALVCHSNLPSFTLFLP